MSTRRIAELSSLILKAKQAYYFGAHAIMSDAAYDALEEELAALAPDHEVLKIVGAPVPPDGILEKAPHRIAMGSQSKVNSALDFEKWYEKSAAGGAVHVSLKGDGASAAAYYEDGRLVQSISRGDGTVGEDITANAIKFQGLPAYAAGPDGPFNGAVRIEVILTLEAWAQVDPSQAKNPRNLGNGIMGRKNGQQSEYLSAFAFDLVDERFTPATETEKLNRLRALGFQCIPSETCPDADAALAYFRRIEGDRDALPFWIDGIVVKIDDLAQQTALGETAGRPKGQVAWKFASEGAETVVESVVLSGGHTGSIVPTAKLRPVTIGGTTVQSALLNNWEEIARLGVAVGDEVFVVKANDIIPKVRRVLRRAPEGTRKEIPEPSECPFCGGDVARNTNADGSPGAVTICQNPQCEMKSSGKIKRWIKALDIQGIGDAVRQAMIERLDLGDPSDLYGLHERRAELAELIINEDKTLRLGAKRADKILEAIEATRHLALPQFLGALGVDGLAQRRVERMMESAEGKLDRLEDWQAGKLRDPDFAQQAGVPNTGERLQDGIDHYAGLIERLLTRGVQVTAATPAPKPDATPKKTLCITGKLPSGRKKGDYKAPLAAHGIALVDEVRAGLDYLVLADPNSTSAKAKKARKLDIPLLSEEELVALLDGSPSA